MTEPTQDQCGTCGAEIDASRTVDYTLEDGTRVCDACFVRGTKTAFVQAFALNKACPSGLSCWGGATDFVEVSDCARALLAEPMSRPNNSATATSGSINTRPLGTRDCFTVLASVSSPASKAR